MDFAAFKGFKDYSFLKNKYPFNSKIQFVSI